MESVLEVEDLHVRFGTRRGVASVVNGVSWTVDPGETLAIVGESGSGKSVGVLSLMGLVPSPPARIEGAAHFDGQDLLTLTDAQLRRIRGRRIAMVFQDPMTSLNPVLTVGRQITEVLEAHLALGSAAARTRAVELLDSVGIASPDLRVDDYPHQMSGGMRQRVVIAMALACEPEVLIADEPTTALDVTVQAQIIELVQSLQAERGTAVVWITHDLGVVAGMADRVQVMYAGRVVESGSVDAVFAAPTHPYTRGLLGSLPVLGAGADDLVAIRGLPPDPTDLPEGCAFWPRCPVRGDARCATERPPLIEVGPGHSAAVLYPADAAEAQL